MLQQSIAGGRRLVGAKRRRLKQRPCVVRKRYLGVVRRLKGVRRSNEEQKQDVLG